MSKEWTDKLKKGDKVIISGRYSKQIEVVERVTKTLIITEKNSRYNKESTCSVPYDAWGNSYINQWTKEEADSIRVSERRSFIVGYIQNKQLSGLNLGKLEKIYELMSK